MQWSASKQLQMQILIRIFLYFVGVCGELYSIQKQIEQFTGEKMSKDEIQNGFINK
jgi:uncharacterized membrane protein YqgA involved in biofilm formation